MRAGRFAWAPSAGHLYQRAIFRDFDTVVVGDPSCYNCRFTMGANGAPGFWHDFTTGPEFMMDRKHPGPQFIGIGAQKAGTTWLSKNLGRHPDVWIVPQKEIHYFDRSSKYLSSTRLAEKSFLKRARKLSVWVKIARAVRARDMTALKRLTATYDDNWYLQQFSPAGERVAGEITPSYSMLDLSDARKVHALIPDVRIIYLMRNPIERAWSQARVHFGAKIKLGGLQDSDFIEFIASPHQHLRSCYLNTLDVWTSVFPAEQMFIGFYDEIIEHPEDLLTRLFRFLGVDSLRFKSWEAIRIPVLVSEKMEMPPAVRKFLCERYFPEIDGLRRRFGSYPQKWFEAIEGDVGQAR